MVKFKLNRLCVGICTKIKPMHIVFVSFMVCTALFTQRLPIITAMNARLHAVFVCSHRTK